MTFEAYMEYFDSILKNETTVAAPYDDADFFQYTKMNGARMHRWLKTGKILPEVATFIAKIETPQHWIVITEPWCGDAAHSVPFIDMMARLNDHITVSYELRDEAPHRIDQYLSNGSKSIPIVIVKNAAEEDLAVWGPRPATCQQMYEAMKAADNEMEDIKIAIQNWYNEDKGVSIQKEWMNLLNK